MIHFDITCNLCGQSEFTVMESHDKPFYVLRCNNCCWVFVYPWPKLNQLEAHYNAAYYEKWLCEQNLRRNKMWAKRLTRIEKFLKGGKLLDVGCGEGSFLKCAQENGWQVNGTELSPYAAAHASKLLGNNIFNGELEDAGYADNTFDVVTMWHVLEHVCDPKKYLTEIHRILRPAGFLALAIPNVKNMGMQIAYRVIKRRPLKLFSKSDKEVHLYHFSPATIEAYLKITNFECIQLGPDFGIVEFPKRLVNILSVIPYYLARIKIFNAIEVFALRA